MRHAYDLLAVAVIGIVAAFLAAEIVVACDVYAFKLRPILVLAGYKGFFTLLLFNVGLLWTAVTIWNARRNKRRGRISTVVILLFALLLLWIVEWMFMESPLTVRIERLLKPDVVIDLAGLPSTKDFEDFSLVRRIVDEKSRNEIHLMYERIRLNFPEVYRDHPIGETIDRYAALYEVDPALLFFLIYVDSFYGESVSGPVPFLGSMTSETIRDIIQIHLPGWFVEARLRSFLISTDAFESVFGSAIGYKLRYAVHKATLDVSTTYALNTYSDVFLVMREFPGEFPELTPSPTETPVVEALRSSFESIRDSAMLTPYEEPYSHEPYRSDYYDAKRDDLKRFARAAYYLVTTDFEFATRAQALLSKYQRNYYSMRLGSELWEALPHWQQTAMLAMIRDMYTPNIGRLGYNLYALQEINCTPLEFVASEAMTEVGPTMQAVWRPKHYEYLWAGAASRLRIFSEVWRVIHGSPLPGIKPEDEVADDMAIVGLDQGRLLAH